MTSGLGRFITATILAALPLFFAPVSTRAQTPDAQIVEDFMTLELAGWRLPEPTEECLSTLQLQVLEAEPYGNPEMSDQPELVDPPGPHFRVVRIEPDSGDRRRRVVRIEWLLPGAGGATRAVADSFTYMLNAAGSDRGAASMIREPERLIVRRECFGG